MDVKPGHRALRRGRVSIEGQIYLVTFATCRRRRLFEKFSLARVAAATLAAEECWLDAGVLCWVLMPDHWHGLVQLQEDQVLSRCVNRAKSASAYRVNLAASRSGRIWQKAFHDHALRREEDLRSVARYIVANPLRAGLVERVGDYPFWDAVWL